MEIIPIGKAEETKNGSSKSNSSIRFENIMFQVKKSMFQGTKTKAILKNVSGKIDSGEVLAVLGPSGSGKTTLLDTLFLHPKVQNASNITIEGTITLDSYKMTRAAASRHCAYVSQFVNESLYPALSTIETLRFSASLSDVDPSRSDELCKSLGLWNYRDVKVGNAFMKGLSGGQKKRLSLGCELLDHECRFLFIDEPTSGLDAKSAIEIIKLIRKIAMDRKCGIIMAIHQPTSRVFYGFDRVMLLSEGRVSYFGKSKDMLPHFEKMGFSMKLQMNPADFVLELVNSDFGEKKNVQKIIDTWHQIEKKNHEKDLIMTHQDSAKGFSFKRTWILIQRSFISISRNPELYILRFFMYAVMSLFLGFTYYDAERNQRGIPDMIMSILWTIAFFSYMCMISLPAFLQTRAIVIKEITNGRYTLGEYIISLMVTQCPATFFCGVISSTGSFWIACKASGLNPHFDAYLLFSLALGVHLYTIEALAILIASMFPGFIMSNIVLNSLISQLFVFNGYFITVGNMLAPMKIFYYISPFAYTTRALFKIVFDESVTYDGYGECINTTRFMNQNDDVYPCFGNTGDDVLDSISTGNLVYKNVDPWTSVIIVLSIGFAYRIIMWLFFRRFVYVDKCSVLCRKNN